MVRVKIAELKDRLSEHLRAVERGEEIVVTHRDRPIARIVPFVQPARRVQIRSALQPFSTVRDKKVEPGGWPISSTELLLEERAKR